MSRYRRWNELLELLAAAGQPTIDDAAKALNVSAATIRRDFDELASQQMLTRIRGGADPPGKFMLDQLAAEGVDVSAVVVRGGPPTGMTVALSRGGDRAILTALGAVASLTAADIPAALLARSRHVHASSYFLLEDCLGPGLAGLLSAARAAGATTSLDTNWDPSGRWGDERLSAAIAQADVLLPNETEALRLSGAATLDEAAAALTAPRTPAAPGTFTTPRPHTTPGPRSHTTPGPGWS